MNLADLGVLYCVSGALSGVFVYRSQARRDARALGSALVAVPLWPLWLPVLLSSQRAERVVQRSAATETEAALLEGHEAVRNTPLEPLLPRSAVDRLLGELRRATERYAELSHLLSKKGFDRQAAEERVARLSQRSASPRTLASARLHLENVVRLQSLAARDRRALEELSELIAALRTQLVFARYSGSSPGEASDIVTEVWARVEMLGTSSDGPPFELDSAPAVEDYAFNQARPDSG
ncbi:MAG TPA: hypothetical protein VFK05_22685 [Polyangiaceae bacterium]|nr:hypothetical protein [Polyangiaceae bacterium]